MVGRPAAGGGGGGLILGDGQAQGACWDIYFLNLICKDGSSKSSNITAQSLVIYGNSRILREIPKIGIKTVCQDIYGSLLKANKRFLL
jgi:hypothetical protein